MENALIIGASGGIGAAVAQEMSARGVTVTGLSRSVDGLDVTDPASVARVMGDLSGPYDCVFIAVGVLAPTGGVPEKSLGAIDANAMAQVMAVNAIGPALLLAQLPRLLSKDRASVVGVLSARVGSIGDNQIGGWHSYRASKAAVNQIVHGAAIELRRSHKGAVCVALHPGTVATPFTADYAGRHSTVSPDEAARNLVNVMAGLTPADTGRFFDYAGKSVPW
ncbi:SDR family NAD(P)-dependent oxidoreductase [Octadecabacter sp. R77987]|uniref:SDR family NAD(P)-dependent oxidoreductase n=1 Tax=Octadecabacter sp. R77987 TaxID=3093874 RepID=UPI00366B86C2